jgi:hypothetical protein
LVDSKKTFSSENYWPNEAHLAKQLQRRFLEINQSETRMACGGHAY